MPARCQPRRPRGCPNLGFRGWLLNESEPIAATLPVSRDPRPAAPFESQTKSPACNSNHFNPLRAVKYPLTNSLPHGTLLHDTSPFEQIAPASLAESIASTLPKMEDFNPLLSNSFHTLQKTIRGIPPPSHFRNSPNSFNSAPTHPSDSPNARELPSFFHLVCNVATPYRDIPDSSLTSSNLLRIYQC